MGSRQLGYGFTAEMTEKVQGKYDEKLGMWCVLYCLTIVTLYWILSWMGVYTIQSICNKNI